MTARGIGHVRDVGRAVHANWRLFGRDGLDYSRRARSLAPGTPWSFPIPGSDRRCLLRVKTSDLQVYVQMLVDREYDLEFTHEPAVIIDAGAHIGLASVFFAQRWPGARIIAIEPDPGNFDLLVANTRDLPQVTPVRAALAGVPGPVRLLDPGIGAWGYRTAADGDGEPVDGVTMDEVLRRYDVEHVDLLKLDIEGAETQVLPTAESWLDRVDVIAAELHDRYVRGCSLAFYSATAGFDTEWHRGENVFVARAGSAHPL